MWKYYVSSGNDVPLPQIFIYLFDEVLFSQKYVFIYVFSLLARCIPLPIALAHRNDVAANIYNIVWYLIFVWKEEEEKKTYKLFIAVNGMRSFGCLFSDQQMLIRSWNVYAYTHKWKLFAFAGITKDILIG